MDRVLYRLAKHFTPVFLSALFALALAGCPHPSDQDHSPVHHYHYIQGSPFSRLILEIDYVPGTEPSPAISAQLASRLSEILDKEDGIEAITHQPIEARGSEHAWTVEELRALAKEHFNMKVPADAIKMHIMFVDGFFAENSESKRVLGLAFGHRHIVMFKQTLEESCRQASLIPALQNTLCEMAELTVWTHEVGHVLGLVDNGIPMLDEHRDIEHGRHCSNEECVMYWAYKGENLIDVLKERLLAGNENSPGFDQMCLQDIAAIRNQ